jgi:hypothetical protein
MTQLKKSRINDHRIGGIFALCSLLLCTIFMVASIGSGTTTKSTRLMNYISTSDAPQPPVVSHPPDISYTAGQTGNLISWSITGSITGAAFQILQNGNLITSGSWSTTTPVIWTVDGLAPGTYNFTILATNTYNTTSDIVFVTVSPDVRAMDGPVVGVVVGFACVGALVVIVAIKQVPMSANKRKDVNV